MDFQVVLTYDLDESKCNSTFEEVVECDYVFIPTPMNSDGSCNRYCGR
jgi:hypothetical protein